MSEFLSPSDVESMMTMIGVSASVLVVLGIWVRHIINLPDQNVDLREDEPGLTEARAHKFTDDEWDNSAKWVEGMKE